MIGILVFTQKDVLMHKLQDGKIDDDRYCYWEMGRFPKRLDDAEDEEVRLYIAVKGIVRGYFEVFGWDRLEQGGELHFHSDSWHYIADGEQLKPSQGFRYYDGGSKQ